LFPGAGFKIGGEGFGYFAVAGSNPARWRKLPLAQLVERLMFRIRQFPDLHRRLEHASVFTQRRETMLLVSARSSFRHGTVRRRPYG
jgi:hypothetical protein